MAPRLLGRSALRGRSGRRTAFTGVRARVARFFNHPPAEERMISIDTGIHDGHDGSAAVIAGGPGLVALDERNTLRQERSENLVLHHRHDIVASALEDGQRPSVELQGQVGKALIVVNDAMTRLRQSREDPTAAFRDRLTLRRDGGAAQQTSFRNVAARSQVQFDDDADSLAARGTIAQVRLNVGGARLTGRFLRRSKQREDRDKSDRR